MKKILLSALVLGAVSVASADLTFYIPAASVEGANPADFTLTLQLDFFGTPANLNTGAALGPSGNPLVYAMEIVNTPGAMGFFRGFTFNCGGGDYVGTFEPTDPMYTTFYSGYSEIPMPGPSLAVPAMDCGGAVVEANEIPVSFELKGAFPNPFNPTTTIEFALPTTEMVSLSVYNINGQLVNTLVDGAMVAGNHSVTFDASNLSSGVYLYTIEAGAFTATNKMVLVK